jgi:hypothetical protein
MESEYTFIELQHRLEKIKKDGTGEFSAPKATMTLCHEIVRLQLEIKRLQEMIDKKN